MDEIEIEATYLLKYIPNGLEACASSDIHDKYLISGALSKLRLRKKDHSYALTKKVIPDAQNASVQVEQTIQLSSTEFNLLNTLPGQELHKVRYYYEYNGLNMEIDVFQDQLHGLISAECEFPTEREKATFVMPDFCLVDVTQEKFIAQVQGKTYSELEPLLNKFSYKKIEMC